MEDDQTRKGLKWKMTKMEANQSGCDQNGR